MSRTAAPTARDLLFSAMAEDEELRAPRQRHCEAQDADTYRWMGELNPLADLARRHDAKKAEVAR